MEDEKKPYTVRDHRRVGARGERLAPLDMKGRREINFKDSIRTPIDTAFRYFRAQVEHLDGSRWPKAGDLSAIVRGFILSTHQLYASTILLMADDRPKPLVLSAGVVARALVEGLGNLFAILEDPATASALFLKDDYRQMRKKTAYHLRRFGDRPGYAKELEKLEQYASAMNLTAEEIANPEKKLLKWPTPFDLLQRKSTPHITGERRRVFEEIYHFWYGSLSTLAHHRLTALQFAVFTEEQPNEETFMMMRSATTSLAIVVELCVMSEIEAVFRFAPSTELRVAWETVKGVDAITETVYAIRYGKLLGPHEGSP